MIINNFWSLNVDEAFVADKLQIELKSKNYEKKHGENLIENLLD
jgi:hypothetical protein